MIEKLSILYIGSLDNRSNSFRRYKTLKELCPKTEAINTDPYILNKYFISVQHHFNIGPGIILINRKIREVVKRIKLDIVFVDNKPYLNTKTLRRIKKIRPEIQIINLITDDPFGRYSKSWRILNKTAYLYDIIFVQREVNIQELKNISAKRVEICYRSYDPDFHRPLTLSKEDEKKYKTKVGFIGTYEENREEYILHLLQNGVDVSITGDGWPKGKYWKVIEPHYRGPSIYGEDYIKTINGMTIALHFLRHANRDEQDSRTFEIPACKVFMLAESSEVHLQLFNGNKEAVFFTSKEELLNKVLYYIGNMQEREQIAKGGFQRCVDSKYSHEGRMKMVIEKVIAKTP